MSWNIRLFLSNTKLTWLKRISNWANSSSCAEVWLGRGDVIKKGLALIQNSTWPESKPILTIKTAYVLHWGESIDLWDIYHVKWFYSAKSSITPIKQVSADRLQKQWLMLNICLDLINVENNVAETFLLFDGTYFPSWYRYRYLDSCGGIWVLIHCMEETWISFSPLVHLSMCESSRCTRVWTQIETTSSARSRSSSKFWYGLFVVRT